MLVTALANTHSTFNPTLTSIYAQEIFYLLKSRDMLRIFHIHPPRGPPRYLYQAPRPVGRRHT